MGAQITLGGNDYEVFTLTGTYSDLLPRLSTTPWFTSSQLAESAASQAHIGGNVFFAFGVNSGAVPGYVFNNGIRSAFYRYRQSPTTVNTFALAELIGPVDPEPVPEPVSGLAILTVGAVVAGVH